MFSLKYHKALLLVFCVVFMEFCAFGMIIPLSPFLAREFGGDDLQVGLLMSVYSLAQLLMAPFWGYLSDKWGRRPVLLICLVGVALFHLWFSLARDLSTLFLTRLFCGVFGAVMSVSLALIADVTGQQNRSKNMGLVGAAIGLGFVTGPFLGGFFGVLGERWGSTPPFGHSFAAFGAFLLCLVNVLVVLVFLKQREGTKRLPHPPFPVFLKDALHSFKKGHLHRVRQVAEAIKTPVLKQILFMHFLLTLALAGIEVSLFLYVKDEFMWSHFKASMGFAFIGLMMALTQGILVRRCIPAWGERTTVLRGLLLGSVGFSSLALASDTWFLALSVTVLCVGYGLACTGLSGAVSLLSHQDRQGLAFGVYQSLFALARITGPALGGLLYRDTSHQAPFYLSGLLSLWAFSVALRLKSTLFPQKGQIPR